MNPDMFQLAALLCSPAVVAACVFTIIALVHAPRELSRVSYKEAHVGSRAPRSSY